MADLLFDPLAIVRVHCCVYIRAREMHWTIVNVCLGKSDLRTPRTGLREFKEKKVEKE